MDEAAKLRPLHVLPDHSPVGDGSLVAQERAFLAELRERALALKRQGANADEAGKQLTAEFKMKYPDWSIDDLTGFVKGAYAEWASGWNTAQRREANLERNLMSLGQ